MIETLLIVTEDAVLFVRVTLVALLVVPTVRLAKFTEAGAKETAKTPEPFKLTVCGLLLALSLMVREPEDAPVTVGVNVTEIVHFFPAFTKLPQLFV